MPINHSSFLHCINHFSTKLFLTLFPPVYGSAWSPLAVPFSKPTAPGTFHWISGAHFGGSTCVLVAQSLKSQNLGFDSHLPVHMRDESSRSILEIPSGKVVAIEIPSFSIFVGFLGVRLGWTMVLKDLLYSNGFSIRKDYNRLV